MTDASIAIAATGRDWALGLHRFVADHGGARVRVRVMQPEQALEESYDVLVIDDVTSFLSAHFVRQVQERGPRVLGVFAEPAGEQRLARLGVNAVIRTDATPESFVSAIAMLAAQRTVDHEFAELIADLHREEAQSGRQERGRIVVVAGAGGGVGATEVAVTLSADLAGRGGDVCLVDADDLAPTVAQRLDLPLHPNLRTALDHLLHAGGPVKDALLPHRAGFHVLAGLPNPRDWGDLRAGGALDVVTELSSAFEVVVVNVSPIVEPTAAGPRGEGRFGLSRLLVGAADAIVLTASPTPMGVGRIIEWLADVQGVVGEAPIHVVVNRFADGTFARGEIATEIADVLAPASLTFAPNDTRLTRAAWEGRVATGSGFSRALAPVGDELTGRPARRSRLRS